MFRTLTLICLFAAIATSSWVNSDYTMPTPQVDAIADGLNIEGGIPFRSMGQGQLWANLCAVLDRPFKDGVDLEEISRGNPYPLKESSLLEYNETQVLYTFLSAIGYYIRHAGAICKKQGGAEARLVVQIHRNSSGLSQLRLLQKIMDVCFTSLNPIKRIEGGGEKNTLFEYSYPDYGVAVEYRYGYNLENLTNYQHQDLVLSLSLVSGFNPDWPASSILLPDTIIPFDMDSMEIDKGSSYDVGNHLLEILPELIRTQDLGMLETLNAIYQSPNPDKTHQRAHPLSQEDFHPATLLQANGLFNPKTQPGSLRILE